MVGGGGGEGSSDSCFPSALSQLQSAGRNLTGPEQQSAAQRSVGRGGAQKYHQLEGHPNLFARICGVSGPLVQCYVQIRGPKASSSHRHLGAIMPFPHCFPSFHPLFCVGAQLSWLVQVLAPHLTPHPTCNLRLAALKSSHSCTGAYISACSSPHQEQESRSRMKTVVFILNVYTQDLLSTTPIFLGALAASREWYTPFL